MLTIHDRSARHTRRDLLRIGTLGLGGLSLPGLLAARDGKIDPLTGRSVIFLFQQGGPSQLETFDPKPDAPDGIRTATDIVRTSIPGVAFAEPMSQLAALAHKLTIVRSFHTNNSGHNIRPIVSKDSLDANIGVHYSRVAGATRAKTGMPTNTVLFPSSVCADVPGPEARGNLAATGPYPSTFAPFMPGAGSQLQKDMALNVGRKRFMFDRRELFKQLDRLNRRMDTDGQVEALDELQQQALEVVLSGRVAKAFDLSNEDPRVVARYDTARYASRGRWHKVKRGKKGYYSAQAESIGKLLLMARRLCEAGCGFVTVHAGYAGVWDMHADGNNLNVRDGMEAVGRSFDHAVAAFIEDLEARGQQDKILLVATGEMGRTPKINPRGGRDHWARLAPLLLYGGGMAGGRVIGKSTPDGGEPDGTAYGPSNLISTILHTQLDFGKLRLMPEAPKQVMKLAEAPPIGPG